MLVSAPPLSFRDGRSLAPNRKYGHAALRSLERRGENLTAGRGFLDQLSVVFFLHPSSFLRLGVGGRFPRDSTSARDRPCSLQGAWLLFSPFRLHALWPFMRTRSPWRSADRTSAPRASPVPLFPLIPHGMARFQGIRAPDGPATSQVTPATIEWRVA